jgi:hypothetical protein
MKPSARLVACGWLALVLLAGIAGSAGSAGRATAAKAAGGAGALLEDASADRHEAFAQHLSEGLLRMGLTPSDCRIRHDYARPDVFRLPLVDSLMFEPTTLLSRIDALATLVESDSTLPDLAIDLCRAMAIDPCMELPACAAGSPSLEKRVRDVRGKMAHLPPGLKKALLSYSGQLGGLALLRDAALASVRPQLGFIYENSPFLVTPRQDYEDVDPFALDSLERAETALGDSILSLAGAMDARYLAAASVSAARAAEALLPFVEHFGADSSRGCCARKSARYNGGRAGFAGRTSTVTGSISYLGLTDQGPIVVGGWDDNTYSGAFALILDLGGNDTYDLAFDRAVNFSLVIDKQGDDSYTSDDCGAVAGAVLGTSVLIDLGGNDVYRAGDVSLGAGIYGCGILYDREGEDIYASGAFSQGAGFVGWGILRDDAGNDSYTAGMQSQAFGYVGGAGVILERGGNDTYLTKMAQTDILRYDDHYLTLSQGCAFGYRPDYSGGIGLLVESGGNDLYSSDIFGQGVGYWFCAGAIVDRSGHDCYRSYQYAQGAGIHLAFGLLSDQSGDDYYVSKGVSQGCGHDLSLGLLADFSGNDCYTAVDLSQGAGSANGTGILYDADGVDSYSVKNKVNVNGYGDYRREFGSIGLEIDAAGEDFYAARGENESLWESGRYGLGVDIPGEAARPRGDIEVKPYPFEERDFTTEELYVLAMRSEPRFQAWKTYAFDRMVADSMASIGYLRTVLDTKDATKRHAIKDILVKIGAAAVPMLSDEVRGGNDLAKSEAGWILGLIENPGGFDALMELSRSDDWKQRSDALNSLARLKGLSPDEEAALRERVAVVLADTAEVFYVRKDAAFAAGNRLYPDLAPRLAACLDDAHYSTRFAAAEALRQLSRTPPVAPSDQVAAAIEAVIPDLPLTGLIPALYAAGNLPAEARMDVAESALNTTLGGETEAAAAVARLLKSVAPGTDAQTRRLAALKARLPQDSWEVKAAAK